MSQPHLTLLVLRCADLEVSARFYEALGFTLAREQHGSGPVHYSARAGGVLLELYPSATATGPVRLGLELRDPVGAAAAALLVGGKPKGSRLADEALLLDPDGNTLHLSLAHAVPQVARRYEEALDYVRSFINVQGDPAPYDPVGLFQFALATIDNLRQNHIAADLEALTEAVTEEQRQFVLSLADALRARGPVDDNAE